MDVSGSCSKYRNNISNVFLDNGLHIRATRGEFSQCPRGGCIFSGRLHSAQSWVGGIFFVTAKIPKKDTLWPALWLTASDGKWPNCGEIDIMETWGTPLYAMGTVHCGNSSEDRTANPGVPVFPKNKYPNKNSIDWNEFNTYVVNWQKNKIDFFLNPTSVDSNGVTGTPVLTIYSAYWYTCPPLTTPLNWIFNLAVGGYEGANCGLGNCWDECQSAAKSEMIITRVQVWQ